jgi:hypothetical protein
MKHLNLLWSELESVAYDFKTHTATLHQPARCCTDMRGAVRFCQYHFPGVRRIVTTSGGKPDVSYTLRGAGWKAGGQFSY